MLSLPWVVVCLSLVSECSGYTQTHHNSLRHQPNWPRDYLFSFPRLIRRVGNDRTIDNYIVNTSLGISQSLTAQQTTACLLLPPGTVELIKRAGLMVRIIKMVILLSLCRNYAVRSEWVAGQLEWLSGWCGWNLMKSQSPIQMILMLSFDWSPSGVVSVHLNLDSTSKYYCAVLVDLLERGISDFPRREMCVYNYKCLRRLIAEIYYFPY